MSESNKQPKTRNKPPVLTSISMGELKEIVPDDSHTVVVSTKFLRDTMMADHQKKVDKKLGL